MMLRHRGVVAETILGPVDALKLRSCATLFLRAAGVPGVFDQVLAEFYHGQPCALTVSALGRAE